MRTVFQDLQRRNHQRHAHPVIEGFGQVGFAVRQDLKIGARDDRIPQLHAGFLYLGLAGRADIDVHILALHDLLAFLGGQQMRRLGSDDPGHIAFGCLDQHTLAQQHLVKPAAQGQEFDEAFLGDLFHHESRFHPCARPASPAARRSRLSARR